MDANWQPIETAPKDGTAVILWVPGVYQCVRIGSFRSDDFREKDGPLWLENDHDDFSTGYASTPLCPTHWMPLPSPPI